MCLRAGRMCSKLDDLCDRACCAVSNEKMCVGGARGAGEVGATVCGCAVLVPWVTHIAYFIRTSDARAETWCATQGERPEPKDHVTDYLRMADLLYI